MFSLLFAFVCFVLLVLFLFTVLFSGTTENYSLRISCKRTYISTIFQQNNNLACKIIRLAAVFRHASLIWRFCNYVKEKKHHTHTHRGKLLTLSLLGHLSRLAWAISRSGHNFIVIFISQTPPISVIVLMPITEV